MPKHRTLFFSIILAFILTITRMSTELQQIGKTGGTFVEKGRTNHNNETLLATAGGSEASPETSILILSSLIPTHPSIKMINETFNSLSMLSGISPRTPIFIVVDGLPMEKLNEKSIHKLHEYVTNLRRRFQNEPRVTILNNYEHLHVSNSIKLALEFIDTEYIYVLQHDLKFVKSINHKALIESMRQQPEEILIVRFLYDKRNRSKYVTEKCRKIVYTNGLSLERGMWSDQNHLTTKRYYERLLLDIGRKGRFPEAPMMKKGAQAQPPVDCTYLFPYVYNATQGPFIAHLDGQHITSY
mmetsp:Transcript_29897/g.45305  ORF Transcript_29897/g.45305 Transcript_29897/m.45305 type:complete len:299 (+) Transcript_29897:92-988(+)